MTILVDRELRTRLERAAAASERSLGAEVRVALKRHLGAGVHDVCDAPPIVAFSGFLGQKCEP